MVSRSHSALATKIMFGLAAGAVFGLIANFLVQHDRERWQFLIWIADQLAQPIGQLFLRLLFMIVVPLVFCSITLGVAGIGDLRNLGRIGWRTLAWFLITTAMAGALGLALVNVFQPGAQIDRAQAELIRNQFASAAQQRVEQGAQGPGFGLQLVVDIVPSNVVAAAADNRAVLGLILFALLLGIAMTRRPPEASKPLHDLLQCINDLCITILGFVMRLAPIAVTALVYVLVAKLGMDMLHTLLRYLLVAMGGLLVYQFGVLTLLAVWFGGVPAGQWLRKTRGLVVTAFSTSSSNATLPTTIRTATEEFSVPPNIAGFVLPLGATMNMNGTALFEGVVVLFLAQVAGVSLDLGQQVLVLALTVLTAIGAAGVPGGSLPLIAVVLERVGVPPAMLGLILGVDRLVDMARTVPNVCSDLLCSIWIARSGGSPGRREGSEHES